MSHQASQPFFTLGAIVALVVLIAQTFFRLVGEKRCIPKLLVSPDAGARSVPERSACDRPGDWENRSAFRAVRDRCGRGPSAHRQQLRDARGEKPLTWAVRAVAFVAGVPVLFTRPGGAGFGDVALPLCLR